MVFIFVRFLSWKTLNWYSIGKWFYLVVSFGNVGDVKCQYMKTLFLNSTSMWKLLRLPIGKFQLNDTRFIPNSPKFLYCLLISRNETLILYSWKFENKIFCAFYGALNHSYHSTKIIIARGNQNDAMA